jgi:hypothetical protein
MERVVYAGVAGGDAEDHAQRQPEGVPVCDAEGDGRDQDRAPGQHAPLERSLDPAAEQGTPRAGRHQRHQDQQRDRRERLAQVRLEEGRVALRHRHHPWQDHQRREHDADHRGSGQRHPARDRGRHGPDAEGPQRRRSPRALGRSTNHQTKPAATSRLNSAPSSVTPGEHLVERRDRGQQEHALDRRPEQQRAEPA